MNIRRDWGAAIESYLVAQRAGGAPDTTLRARGEHLAHIARRVVAGPFDLTAAELVDYAGRQDWAQETRRSRRTTMLSFYRWAKDAGHVRSNPAKRLPQVSASPPDPRPVPDDVYAAALRRASPRERLMLMLAAELGLRRAEVAQVHSDDLLQDLAGWSIVVHGKGNRRRMLPMPPRVALELRALPAGYAFPGADRGHLSPRWIGKVVGELLGRGWTMHKLRHRAATRWHQLSGGDTFKVQQALGHASPATTRHYVFVPPDSLRDMVEAAAS